ncbi:MAG: PilN domain-containing protein [Candidatus Angelobacter sp.]
MAVQFNLLPDVKLEFNRAQHTKRLVYTISFLAMGIAVGLFIISFVTVDVLQKKLLNDASNDINNYNQQLKSIPDLAKILTIQHQLESLQNLHTSKHYVSRLFSYIPQVTPTNLNMGKLDLDATANTMEITGTADTVQTVNKFVDTLKYTSYTMGGSQSSQKLAFSNVTLSKIDRNGRGASYTVDLSFDPALFTGTSSVSLSVPKETTTRSVLDTPNLSSLLFNGDTGKNNANSQGNQ